MKEKPEKLETKTFSSSELDEIKQASKKEVETKVFTVSEIEKVQNDSKEQK